jgi:hypothetical protein
MLCILATSNGASGPWQMVQASTGGDLLKSVFSCAWAAASAASWQVMHARVLGACQATLTHLPEAPQVCP